MFLTIILPTVSNKELLSKIRKEKKEHDELIYFKVRSNNVREIINSNILKSQHNNVLIINSSDPMCMKKGFIEFFRKEGTLVSNVKDDGLSIKSSIKFTKSQFEEIDKTKKCLNVKDYINAVYNGMENIDKYLNTKEEYAQETKKQTTKPKILLISDVRG